MQFDADGDGKLDIHELARAFRALGLPKRDGDKLQMDQAMFKSFDTNGDGFCSPEELEKNLYPKTRKKIEEKLDAGWKFNKKKWDESVARHKRWDMSKVFKQFDSDGAPSLISIAWPLATAPSRPRPAPPSSMLLPARLLVLP